MKKIILSFCILIFGVSVAIADEMAIRLIDNCMERAKLNDSTSNNLMAECMVKIETMVV